MAQPHALRSVSFLLLAIILVSCGQDVPSPSTTSSSGNGFTDHGVAAPVARARGVAATSDQDGNPIILAWPADHRGTGSILIVDAATGESEQVEVPGGYGPSPYANLLSTRNRFYSLFNNRFFEFDAGSRSFTFSREVSGRFAMSITEGPDGRIWAASYPDSHLLSYDPETGELREHGTLNEESWPQYPRAIAVGSSGWLYVGIGTTESQIIAYNPETGTRRRLAEPDERRTGHAPVWRGTDGNVYGRLYPDGSWYELADGRARRISEPPVERKPIMHGSQSAVLRNFPDGWQLEEVNLPEKWALVRKPDRDEPVHIRFDYETAGSHVMSLVKGPEDVLYGSTGHPLRLYTFDPKAEELSHRGLMGLNGHLNALDVLDGRLYMGLYARGGLLCYAPGESWDDRGTADSNPGLLFWATPTIHRPHAVVAHANGRHVVMGGTPDYGRTGGGLAIYDRQTGSRTLVSHEELLEYHSPYAMAGLSGDRIAVGTTTSAGTGGESRVDEAQLFVYDLVGQEITYQAPAVPGAREITDLLAEADGERIFGIAERDESPMFFGFDPRAQQVLQREALTDYGRIAGVQGSRVMVQGADGTVYILFRESIVTVDPDSYAHQKLAALPVRAGAGLALHDGRLYFASESHLWSYNVP
jgi:outer membrane protein assembly factor BamB